MSARDEQPATVPPPAGEDDAYNATTKVGAMPAEVMARLRAEGLLPEEEAEQEQKVDSVPRSPRQQVPASSRPTPVPSGPIPMLYSTAPPALTPTAAPPAPPARSARPPASPPPPQLGTFDNNFDFDDPNEPEPETTLALEPPPTSSKKPMLPSIRLETPSAELKPDPSITAGGFLGSPPSSAPAHHPPAPAFPLTPPRPSAPAAPIVSPVASVAPPTAPGPVPTAPAPPEMMETPIAFSSSSFPTHHDPNLGAGQYLQMGQQPYAQYSQHSQHSQPPLVAQAELPLAAQPPAEDPALRREVRAFGGVRRLTKPQLLALLVAGMVVVVTLLFIMALVSQRR